MSNKLLLLKLNPEDNNRPLHPSEIDSLIHIYQLFGAFEIADKLAFHNISDQSAFPTLDLQ